jgi:hypothetical protein
MPRRPPTPEETELLGGQSVDEILAAARGTLADTEYRPSLQAQQELGDIQARHAQERAEQESDIVPTLLQAAGAATIPASFLGGPVGIAAALPSAIEGLSAFRREGSSGTEKALAALGLAPFIGPAIRRWKGAGKAAAATTSKVPTLDDIERFGDAPLTKTSTYGGRPARMPSSAEPIDVGAPAVDAIERYTGNVAPRPNRAQSIADAFIEETRGMRRHGTAGFHDLPELAPSEAERIGASIDRITGQTPRVPKVPKAPRRMPAPAKVATPPPQEPEVLGMGAEDKFEWLQKQLGRELTLEDMDILFDPMTEAGFMNPAVKPQSVDPKRVIELLKREL